MPAPAPHLGVYGATPSPRVAAIIAAIPDRELAKNVEATVQACLTSLADLRRIYLPQDHFEEASSLQRNDKHLELAPYVLAAVSSINRLLSHLMETYPAPVQPEEKADAFDFDLEFDLVDGPTGDAKGLSTKSTAAQRAMTPAEQVADAAHAYGGMVRSRVVELAGRLRHAVGQKDTWPLLAELDDYQHRLTKGVMGVLFGVLQVFAGEARREEILPQYRSSIADAVALRRALADLTFQIARFNAALASVSADDALPLLVGVADNLSRFAERAEYRTLRGEDKKAFIDFRKALYELRRTTSGVSMVKLRQTVEGFSKFLESLQAINHREVLVLHDKAVLEDALRKLDEAGEQLETDPGVARSTFGAVVELLTSVYGRNPELDSKLRHYRGVDANKPRSLVADLSEWQPLVETTLGMTG